MYQTKPGVRLPYRQEAKVKKLNKIHAFVVILIFSLFGIDSAWAVDSDPAKPDPFVFWAQSLAEKAGSSPSSTVINIFNSDEVIILAQNAPAGSGGAGSGGIKLFNSAEMRVALTNMPKWQRVISAENSAPTFVGDSLSSNIRPGLANQWKDLKSKLSGASAMEKVRAVNSFFNQWPYRNDPEAYGQPDYWATPAEFIKKSGDCEDYAIVKYYALKSLGIDASTMRIVVLQDTVRNLAHAVLAVYMNNNIYILDNVSNLLLTQDLISNYMPQFSVNEHYRWAHFPAKGAVGAGQAQRRSPPPPPMRQPRQQGGGLKLK